MITTDSTPLTTSRESLRLRPNHLGKTVRIGHADFQIDALEQGDWRPFRWPFAFQSPTHPALQSICQRLDLDRQLGSARDFATFSQLARLSRFGLIDKLEAYPPEQFWQDCHYGVPGYAKACGACAECSHRLVCLAAALGFIVRKANYGSNNPQDSQPHMCVEMWSDDHQKWVFWDAMIPCYYVDRESGTPLSGVELVQFGMGRSPDQVVIKSWRQHHAKKAARELLDISWQDHRNTSVANYWPNRIYFLVLHLANDYFDHPREVVAQPTALALATGQEQLQWRHRNQPCGYYTQPGFRTTTDIDSLYPRLNQTAFELLWADQRPELKLTSSAPNLREFQFRRPGEDWQPVTGDRLPLATGPQTIEARAVNAGGAFGASAHITLSPI